MFYGSVFVFTKSVTENGRVHVPSGETIKLPVKSEKTPSTNCANVSSKRKRESDLSILFSFQELVVYLSFSSHTHMCVCVSVMFLAIIETARNPTANYANLSSCDASNWFELSPCTGTSIVSVSVAVFNAVPFAALSLSGPANVTLLDFFCYFSLQCSRSVAIKIGSLIVVP